MTQEQRAALLAGIGSLLQGFDDSFLGLGNFVVRVTAAFQNARVAVRDLSEFHFDPKWKSHVINVPKAFNSIDDLWHHIRFDLMDKYDQINEEVHTFVQLLHAEALQAELDVQGQISGLSKAAAGLHHVRTMLEQLGTLIEHAMDLVQLVQQIKHSVETLDALFLSQATTKKTVDAHYRKRQTAS